LAIFGYGWHYLFNQHMPREVVLAPLHFGGLGLLDLIAEQGIAQILFVLSHLRSATSVASTIQILLETYQVSTGITQNPLEATTSCSYVQSPWVQCIQSFLHQCNAQIRVPFITTKAPLRQHDKVIMEYACPSRFTPTELKQINYCRIYLQVLFLSEIVSDVGTHIVECALYGHSNPEGKSILSRSATPQ
jgi:hypothetical protein